MTTRDYKEQGIYIFFQVHLIKKEESKVKEVLGQNVKSEEKGKVLEEKEDSKEQKVLEEKEDSKEQNKPITIAKFYSFSDEKINDTYTMINMDNMDNQDKIDGSNYTISIKSGIQEDNKTILGAAYNGTNTFEIVENTTISAIQDNIQKEKSLLNFYHYGIYDWIIFKKIRDFISENNILDPNQIDLELSDSNEKLRELSGNLVTLESTVEKVVENNGT
jgi:hypothetical protein